jgi:hypothetical protein
VALTRVPALITNLAAANPATLSVTLPAGRLLLAIGSNKDSAAPVVSSVSHPAITAAARIGTQTAALGTSNKEVIDFWDVTSVGGSGTLSITFTTAPYFVGLWGGQLTDAQAAPSADVPATYTSPVSSWTIVGNAPTADTGIVAGVVALGTSGATPTVSPWNTSLDVLTMNTSWHRMFVSIASGSVSGVTQTVGVSAGQMTVVAGRLLLFSPLAPTAGPEGIMVRGPLF